MYSRTISDIIAVTQIVIVHSYGVVKQLTPNSITIIRVKCARSHIKNIINTMVVCTLSLVNHSRILLFVQ